MAVMEDGDFELRGVLLKGTEDYPIYVQQFDPGKIDHRDQDILNPLDDTVLMGQDRIIPPTWEFKLGMGDFTPGPALEALGQLMRVWCVPMRDAGAETSLRYKVGGRVRQVFGRPRPFSFNPEMLVHVGYAVAVASFHLNDPVHYGVDLRRLSLKMFSQSVGGGFDVPFFAPILTDAGSSRNGFATNYGTAPAPFKARINGPVINPGVSGPGWSLDLDHTILEGGWVEVDTRSRTVTTNSGAHIAGRLSRSSQMLSAKLAPGKNEIIFTGTDRTGLSGVELSWYDAYTEH